MSLPAVEACCWQAGAHESEAVASPHYHNCNTALAIDFLVERLPLAGRLSPVNVV